MRGWLNIPNLLTLLRLLLAPATIWAIVAGRHAAALAIFLSAAVTDGLDGALARRLGAITRLGAYLDPVADKVLLSGTYLALALSGRVPLWFVTVVFGRDVLILCGALLLAWAGQRRFPPTVWGKISTLLQSLCALAVLVAGAVPWQPFVWAAGALIWPAAAATLWSGLHYGWRCRSLRPADS